MTSFLFVLLFLGFYAEAVESSLQFTSSLQAEGDTKIGIGLECSFNISGNGTKMENLVSLVISKPGHAGPVLTASLSVFSPKVVKSQGFKGVTEGSMDVDGNRAYLKIYLANPTKYLKGEVKCVASGLDAFGTCVDQTVELSIAHLTTRNGVQYEDCEDIAFSVGMSRHRYLAAKQIVIYDTIFTNEGAAYNSSTGIFTCPLPGLYAFHFHGLNIEDKRIWLELHKNAKYVTSMYGYAKAGYASAGNSAILRLAKGDQVYITVRDYSELYGASDQVYSTFSGYLVSGRCE